MNALKQADPEQRKRGYLSAWIKANLATLCSFDWDSGYVEGSRSAICFLLDTKPYWRVSELKKHDISYKKGRKTRTRKGLSYVKSLLIKEILAAGLPVLGLPGQEADDMAAMLVRSQDPEVKIRLVTTDNDWCGLIDPDSGIDWYCLHGYLPRSRKTLADIQQSKQGKESGIKSLDDFYPLKRKMGDKGDNIPPDAPAWATDLLNPPEAFDPLETPEGKLMAEGIYLSFDKYARVTSTLSLSSKKASEWLIATRSKRVVH
jgi:hypothetical protein